MKFRREPPISRGSLFLKIVSSESFDIGWIISIDLRNTLSQKRAYDPTRVGGYGTTHALKLLSKEASDLMAKKQPRPQFTHPCMDHLLGWYPEPSLFSDMDHLLGWYPEPSLFSAQASAAELLLQRGGRVTIPELPVNEPTKEGCVEVWIRLQGLPNVLPFDNVVSVKAAHSFPEVVALIVKSRDEIDAAAAELHPVDSAFYLEEVNTMTAYQVQVLDPEDASYVVDTKFHALPTDLVGDILATKYPGGLAGFAIQNSLMAPVSSLEVIIHNGFTIRILDVFLIKADRFILRIVMHDDVSPAFRPRDIKHSLQGLFESDNVGYGGTGENQWALLHQTNDVLVYSVPKDESERVFEFFPLAAPLYMPSHLIGMPFMIAYC